MLLKNIIITVILNNMKSKKQKKINQLISNELAELFRQQSKESPIKKIIISVISTKITSDLNTCKVYLSVYPKEYRKKILKEVNKNTLLYRRSIANNLGKILRVIPNFFFFLDTSFDQWEQINNELQGVINNSIL